MPCQLLSIRYIIYIFKKMNHYPFISISKMIELLSIIYIIYIRRQFELLGIITLQHTSFIYKRR